MAGAAVVAGAMMTATAGAAAAADAATTDRARFPHGPGLCIARLAEQA